jgi:hypothetical protein
MNPELNDLIKIIDKLAQTPEDRALVTGALKALDKKYALTRKTAATPGLSEIIQQLMGRIKMAYGSFLEPKGKRILDIACGSNTSRAPSSVYVNTPFGEARIPIPGAAPQGYSALFEPWFPRILLELGAQAVGIDFGDLETETFEHYKIDLGQPGALDFLPSGSFDGVQDSRLFGSPEFTAQFPKHADRLRIAVEIRVQEKRLLKAAGLVIHSDAADLVG